MRIIDDGTIKVSYPDYVFCFNPCVFMVESSDGSFDFAEVNVDVSADGVRKSGYWRAHQNKAYIDLRAYFQLLFDENTLTSSDEAAATCKKVSISMQVSNVPFEDDGESEPAEIETVDIDTLVYWGALRPYEQFDPYKTRKVKYWEGYPFTVDITPDKIDVDISKAQLRVGFDIIVPIDAERKMMRLPYDYGNSRIIFLTFVEGGQIFKYDLVFVEYVGCEAKGVYLRWLDRYGRLCYYLFAEGQKRDKVSNYGDVLRDNITDVVRRMGYEREASMQLCAPLADAETIDGLDDIISSPVVDMYVGGVWQAVIVSAGTYTRTDDVLQDFVFEITLQDYDTQRL